MLARSPLKPILAFKGGTALKRCYFDNYRFSEDLDFTLLQPIELEEILKHLETLYAEIRNASGIAFAFDRLDRHGHTNSHTFYLRYTGPLPGENSVKVDITITEHITRPCEERVVLRSYPEFEDVPEGRAITIYSLAEIAIEKIVALMDAARTEPRDLYDLWYLTTEGGVDLLLVHDGIREKLRFRDKLFVGIQSAVAAKEARLRALWIARLAHQMSILPEFDGVFRSVRQKLREAELP
ncbi:MAG TPA: nucleotidyl transferase AbiEii/AbiGii toxin family protein [Candidatus Cybelea sp.]|nr:nucleotidyl transferase AbiEii/AbiGii toxin family protein [Candidatus Cybelea sp.]